MSILRQLNVLTTMKTFEFRDLVGENVHSMFINNSQEEVELVFDITQNFQKKRK